MTPRPLPARTPFALPFAVVLSCAAAAPALASGGGLKRYNDGVHDGVVVAFSNSTPDDRFMQEYPAGTLGKGAIACAGRVEHRNGGSPNVFIDFELRWEDPANPGFCDLSPSGLIASADPGSFGACGIGDGVTVPTFGNGGGVPIDSGANVYFTAVPPIQVNPDCGLLVDRNNPDYHRGKMYDSASGLFSETTGNLMLDLFVSEPGYFNFTVTMRGRQRFPGDPGLPVMFARRPNTGGLFPQTDDFISATLVYDNFIPATISREITMEVDRSSLRPGLSYRYVPLFRYAGTTAPFAGPIFFQPGRTRIAIDVPRTLKDPILPALPLNLRFRARVWDPDFSSGSPTSVFDVIGLRPYSGVGDDGSAESYTLVRSPGLLRDAMAVRFRAVDLPRTAPYTVTGVELLGREVGGTSLLGFDAIEVRRDDILMANSPDLTPGGLLASAGTVDGVGELPAPGLTVFDLPDFAVDPAGPRVYDLWLIVYQTVNDRTTAGTTLGFDTTADTLLAESFTSLIGTVPYRAASGNFMMRLLLDGRASTLDDPSRGARRYGDEENVPVRDLSTYEVIDCRAR